MNSGRFSGRVESPTTSMQIRTAAATANAKEGLKTRTATHARVTEAAVRRLQSQLTSIDYAVIDTLNTVRIATGAQLRRLHWTDTDSGKRLARHHLAKLTELRLTARLDRRVGGVRAGSDGYTYVLDVAGQRLASVGANNARSRRPATPGDRYLQHALAVTDRYVDLRDLERARLFEVLAFQAEPGAWRQYIGSGRPLTIKPDAFTLLIDEEWEHRWFLEIDRATEHRPTIQRKAGDYVTYWQSGVEQAANGMFPKVLWIAPTESRAEALREWLIAASPLGSTLFDVCTDSAFADVVRRATETER